MWKKLIMGITVAAVTGSVAQASPALQTTTKKGYVSQALSPDANWWDFSVGNIPGSSVPITLSLKLFASRNCNCRAYAIIEWNKGGREHVAEVLDRPGHPSSHPNPAHASLPTGIPYRMRVVGGHDVSGNQRYAFRVSVSAPTRIALWPEPK
jgi:hypothetical protein